MRMIAALMLAVQSPAISSTAPFKDYVGCAMDEATRLSPSGEAAEAIARVAVFECRDKLSAAARAIDQTSSALLQTKGWHGDGQLHTSAELEPKVKAEAEDAALMVLVEARLKAPVAR